MVTALADRRKSVVAANALYGATVSLLMNVLEPTGVKVRFADICDMEALRAAVAEAQPGCILIETISNPLLRVGPDRPDRGDRPRSRRRPGGGQYLRHAADRPSARTGRALQRSQRHQVPGGPRRRAGRRGGDRSGAYRQPAHPFANRGAGARTVRSLSDHARHQDVSPAHGAPVRQRAPRGILAGAHPAVERVYFPGDPAHPDAAYHPPPVSAQSVRRHGRASKSAARAGKRSSASWTH